MFHMMHDNSMQAITGEFNPGLVVLSIVFACVASYTALSLNERLKNKSFVDGKIWLILTAVAMAFGIWSMHYMGMFAYSLPLKVEYDLFYTIVSMVPILFASFLAFYIINLDKVTRTNSIVSSLLISLGILWMHLVGMMSMIVDGHHSNNAGGILLAFLVPFIGFLLLTQYYSSLNKWYMQVLFGIIIGLSASAAHYISMFTMTMHVSEEYILGELVPFENIRPSAIFLTIGIAAMLSVLLFWILIDYFLTKRVERFDTVTHLPNSQQLMLDMEKFKFKQMALWIFNDFEHINKTFGYHSGDQYIQQIVERIDEEINRKQKIYRMGQHQLLLATESDAESFIELQSVLAKRIAEPLFITVNDSPIVAKAICALSNDIAAPNEELLKQIMSISRMPNLTNDLSIIVYNPKDHNLNIQDDLVRDIDYAMRNNELFLVYQPKVFPSEQSIAGVEALLRWHHKEYGFVSPGVFVPLLEQNGKMDVVTDWVIEQACMQIQDWKQRNVLVGPVSINIPGDYLISDALKKCLEQMTQNYNITPKDIELELTETSFVQNLEEAMRAVHYFNELGYGVALDDFGTGLSSLSYLRQMKITTLKVDKAFVDYVPFYRKDVAIAKTIMALGESLDLQVVVEGVERKEQLDFVMAECESPIVQGYYFSKPLFVSELEEMYRNMQSTSTLSD